MQAIVWSCMLIMMPLCFVAFYRHCIGTLQLRLSFFIKLARYVVKSEACRLQSVGVASFKLSRMTFLTPTESPTVAFMPLEDMDKTIKTQKMKRYRKKEENGPITRWGYYYSLLIEKSNQLKNLLSHFYN